MFTRRNAKNPVGVLHDLGLVDFPELLSACCKVTDFNVVNMRAWRRDGMIPFTEEVYWEALDKEMRIEQLQARVAQNGNQPMSSRQALELSAARENTRLGVDIGIGMDVAVPNPSIAKRAALAQAIGDFQRHDDLLRQGREALANPSNENNPLHEVLYEIIDGYTKMASAAMDFVKDNASKIRSADVAFVPGGATSDAALARTELGFNNAKRIAEDALEKQANKKRKDEDLMVQAIRRAPAILARIASLNHLNACTRDQLITLQRSVFRHHPRGQPKKADLIAGLRQAISKEIERRNRHTEPHAELPGVPVPAPVNEMDAELLEITLAQPIPVTETSPEPTPMGGKDAL